MLSHFLCPLGSTKRLIFKRNHTFLTAEPIPVLPIVKTMASVQHHPTLISIIVFWRFHTYDIVGVFHHTEGDMICLPFLTLVAVFPFSHSRSLPTTVVYLNHILVHYNHELLTSWVFPSKLHRKERPISIQNCYENPSGCCCTHPARPCTSHWTHILLIVGTKSCRISRTEAHHGMRPGVQNRKSMSSFAA